MAKVKSFHTVRREPNILKTFLANVLDCSAAMDNDAGKSKDVHKNQKQELIRRWDSERELSSVCNARAPYSGGWNFRQYFYGIW